MIAAILGALGLGGGFAVACVLVPGFAARALAIVKGLIGIVAEYPWQIGVAALLALSAWCWQGWSADNQRNAREIAVGKLALKILAESYVREQALAKARQDQSDRESLNTQIILNAQVEQAHAQLETARGSAVDAYARANPVRLCPGQGAGSAGGGALGAAVPGDPGQPAPAPADSGLVAITRTDLDQLAREAVSGAERFEYLDALIRSKRAIKASDLPAPAF
jgi:hypothetical protein